MLCLLKGPQDDESASQSLAPYKVGRRANAAIHVNRLLPPELLIRIFEFCLPTCAENKGWDIRGLVQLSSTCSLWRAIILHEPGLWARVPCWSPPATRMALDRSKNAPLTVTFSQDLSPIEVSSLLAVLPRMRTLHITTLDRDHNNWAVGGPPSQQVILPLISTRSAAALEELHVEALFLRWRSACHFLPSQFTNLRRMTYAGDWTVLKGSDEGCILSQLSTLCLEHSSSCTLRDLVHVLQESRQLARLRVDVPACSEEQNEGEISNVLVELPSLVGLRLEGAASGIRFFTQAIQTPLLENLVLLYYINEASDMSDILAMPLIKSYMDRQIGVFRSALADLALTRTVDRINIYTLSAFYSAKSPVDIARPYTSELGPHDQTSLPVLIPRSSLTIQFYMPIQRAGVTTDLNPADGALAASFLRVVGQLQIPTWDIDFQFVSWQKQHWTSAFTGQACTIQSLRIYCRDEHMPDFFEALTPPEAHGAAESSHRLELEKPRAILLPGLALLCLIGVNFTQQAGHSTIWDLLKQCLSKRARSGLPLPELEFEDCGCFDEETTQTLVHSGLARKVTLLDGDRADVEPEAEMTDSDSDSASSCMTSDSFTFQLEDLDDSDSGSSFTPTS